MAILSNDTLNVAIIGAGAIGPRHARSVIACPGLTLKCLVDRNPASTTVAAQLGVTLYKSIEQMLTSEYGQLHAAIICTPNDSHVEIGTILVNAGLHVLVEKPIAVSVNDARDLILNAQRASKKLLVGHHRRFNPFITAAKRAIDEGRIGRPIAVSGLWTLCKPPSYFTGDRAWRAKSKSGGPIWINLIHEIDILQYLFGPITRVHAEQTLNTRGYEVEEGAALLFRFANGLVGTFVLSDNVPSGHSFESGTGENPCVPRSGKDFYRVFGSEGTLSVGDMIVSRYDDDRVKSWEEPIRESAVSYGREVPFDEQIKHFSRVIRDDEEPRCSGEDGLSAVIVCGAVKKALTSGNAVDIPDSVS